MYRSRTPRRKSFNFIAVAPGKDEPQRVKVRVYGGLRDAEALLERKGWTDLTYEPKPSAADRRFEVNASALAAAKNTLDIHWPVEIRFRHSEAHKGVCRTIFAQRKHRITIQPGLPVEEASRVLWHELGHCAYNEAHARRTDDIAVAAERVRRERKQHRYAQRPTEVHARWAEGFNATNPLTRAA